MESRITNKFKELKSNDKKALITYVTAGDPDLKTTANLVLEMEKAGADIVELGIPFSDPIADGPIIQAAALRSLKAGTNIDLIFEMLDDLRKKTEIPIAFLLYYNSIYAYGIENFLEKCNGLVDGLIIPDLPLEESTELKNSLLNYPIDLIPLVALTSEDRINKVVKDANGFVYCVSSLGVTGKRNEFDLTLDKFIGSVRKNTDLPLAIGFGISNEEAIQNLKGLADGLIVGSAIVEKIEKGIQNNNVEENVYDFVGRLKKAIL